MARTLLSCALQISIAAAMGLRMSPIPCTIASTVCSLDRVGAISPAAPRLDRSAKTPADVSAGSAQPGRYSQHLGFALERVQDRSGRRGRGREALQHLLFQFRKLAGDGRVLAQQAEQAFLDLPPHPGLGLGGAVGLETAGAQRALEALDGFPDRVHAAPLESGDLEDW